MVRIRTGEWQSGPVNHHSIRGFGVYSGEPIIRLFYSKIFLVRQASDLSLIESNQPNEWSKSWKKQINGFATVQQKNFIIYRTYKKKIKFSNFLH